MAGITNISCNAGSLLSILQAIYGKTSDLVDRFDRKIELLEHIYEETKEIRHAVVHFHDSHSHETYHYAEERWSPPPGGALLPVYAGPVDRLVWEYNNSMDYDDNGLIFGRDFIIDPNDSSIPKALKTIYYSLDKIPGTVMSWDDYLGTVPPEDYMT